MPAKKLHGQSGTPEYAVWNTMVARCTNPNAGGYHKYGARGIQVCARWHESFVAFMEDMGPRPEGMSIERRDNNGNYEPSNCYWADRSTQALNTRTYSNNTSGLRGVAFDSIRSTYHVTLDIQTKRVFSAKADNQFEAYCLRKSAENKYLGRVLPTGK